MKGWIYYVDFPGIDGWAPRTIDRKGKDVSAVINATHILENNKNPRWQCAECGYVMEGNPRGECWLCEERKDYDGCPACEMKAATIRLQKILDKAYWNAGKSKLFFGG